MNCTRRSLLNYVFTLGFIGISAVVGFLTTPWLIRLMGGEQLGAWRALAEWLSTIGLLELGLTTALQGELAQELGKSDDEGLYAVIWAGFRGFGAVGLLMLGCCLAFAGGVHYLIRTAPELRTDLFGAVILSSAGFLLYPTFTLRALAEARGRMYILQAVLIFQSLILAVSSLVFAAFCLGIMGQALAMLAANGAVAVVLAVLHWPDVAGSRRAPAQATREAGRRLWRLNRTAALWGLCGRFQLAGALLLVAAVFDSQRGLDVSVTQRLLYAVGTAVLAVGGATWAAVREAHHRQAGGAVGPLLRVSGLTSTLAAGVLVPLVAINRSFVVAWVGPDRYLGELFSILTAAGLFLYALFNLWAMPLIGVGGLSRLAPTLAAATLTGLAIGVPVTWWLGPLGAVAVVAGVMVVMLAAPVPILLREVLGIPLRPLLARVAAPWVAAAAPTVALFTATHWHIPQTLVEAAAWCAAYVTVFAALVWCYVLTREERTYLLGRLGLRTARAVGENP
jgi:hypothetical protein